MASAEIINEIQEAMEAPKTEWKKSLFDFTATISQPEPLLMCGGTRALSRENLCIITGKPKVCKSTFLSAAMAAGLSARNILNMSSPRHRKIILADTEQAPYHLKSQCDRVFRLAEIRQELSDNFTVLALRPFTPQERYSFVMDAIEEIRPDIVAIDGVSDLLCDSNDLKESENLVSELLAASSKYDLGVISILHTTPGQSKLRGHLGSCLERKAESVVLLEKEGRGICVKPKECRNRAFTEFRFTLNDEGDPEYDSQDADLTALDWLLAIMEKGKEYRHGELVSLLIEKGIPEGSAKSGLKAGENQKRILRVGRGIYTLP
ncbi:MAG: AAA family ATPase [Bacteroidales bacterium]|nr:AAA family ATPase [Candidatus Cacconaster equifaecalis]